MSAPKRHIVIGTAGHVDHGKTALVKALTGIDTDRWEEEKRRGITIDLGFAPLQMTDGTIVSMVDVPGHEDFVRNMVAGATGIDVALLVIAADEGVMPQTVEHVAIVEYLGVRTGVIAVTKLDLVESDWLGLVIEDVRERLAASPIAWEPPVTVSAKLGVGLDDLRGAVARAAAAAPQRSAEDLFRMPVDRVFSVAGAGTVVTGTVWAGSVRTGDEVLVLPAGVKGRVRSIEVHGASSESAVPGRRTALALVGVARDAAIRGSVVVTGEGWQPSRRVDVRVNLLETSRRLTQRSRVRFHIGTAEVMARVTPADGEVAPGGQGVVRLRLESPVVCRWGDRGVLRSYSPVTTQGGCVVIDPLPDPRPRRPSRDADCASPDAPKRVRAFVRGRGIRGLGTEELPVRLGVAPASVSSCIASAAESGVVVSGRRLLARDVADRVVAETLEAIREYHRERPLQPGLPLEAFRRRAGTEALAEHAREQLLATGEIVVERGVVRLTSHQATLEGDHAAYGVTFQEALAAAGPKGVALSEVADRIPPSDAVDVAEYFVRQDTVIRVGGDRYYSRGALFDLARRTVAHLEHAGAASPADLREVLGLTRKYLIPVLEWLDGQGITVRAGDSRRTGPKAHQVH
jgi:selenocysteine-specific elongation factor